MQSETFEQPEPLMDVAEVARYLNVPVSWVHNHASRTPPLLPSYKFGTGKRAPVRFKREELNLFIDEHVSRRRVRRP